ncbi:alpha/beta hydrolase [Salipiger thiooxidans]|uniref:alpha/beta hydrolase n=1 Tax=Salipiger thiooxidans TaxID=282683 RepID=UPI001A8F985A|nr:alpha/beta hydrolase [Salipiger thiooxidans]MBN8190394.1 alpha/beta hydrolase [Salipiger thiooxidans]MCA0851053.1 alpha/beta hydrolase [Salipiger thiooxidans]
MLSPERKAELAAHLRGTSIVGTVFPDDLIARMARVTCEELLVPTRVGQTRGILVTPPAARSGGPLVMNIHGGGFVRGYQERDTMFCALLAEELGCKVLDLDYRLSPEHPFPTALHETRDVLEWIFAQAGGLDIDPARIAMCGHSAGGNLVAAACLMAVQDGGQLPCLQILDYPFLDAVTSPESKIADEPSIFTPERLHAFNDLHVPDHKDRASPLMSPVYADRADLARLPAARILVAGLDPLRHEAERYASLLEEAGVAVTINRFESSDHGFLIANLAEYRAAQDVVLHALRTAFERS